MNSPGNVTRLSHPERKNFYELAETIGENFKRIQDCPGPHDFSIDLTPDRPLLKRWCCTRCRGEVDTAGKRWYELGLLHGAKR